MGYKVEINTVLSLPDKSVDTKEMIVGEKYTVIKDGERLFPLNIPLDLCDTNYIFLAKIAIRKLTLEDKSTEVTFEILKIFSAEESKVITDNFSKHA